MIRKDKYEREISGSTMQNKITRYVKKVWLNPKNSASTGSICVFDGPYKYKSDMEEVRDSFIEIKDCNNGIRLHKTFEDTEQDFINKVELLKSVLDAFLTHLKEVKLAALIK